jgi:hypothetical protein
VFTDRDWLLLFGHPREKVFTLCPGSGSPPALGCGAVIGLTLGFYILPCRLVCFVCPDAAGRFDDTYRTRYAW